MNKRKTASGSSMLENVLSAAVTAVTAVDSGKMTLDDALMHLPDECRRILEHLLIQFYRYRKSIRRSWMKFCRKPAAPEIGALLDSAVTQCRFQQAVPPYSVVNVAVTLAKKHHADKFVNALLRRVLAEDFTIPSAPEDILPDGILKRWQKNFSPVEVARFARLFLMKPEFTFRLCRGAELPEGAGAVWAPGSFRFAAWEAAKVLTSAEFASGSYYIQDPAAALAVSLAEEVAGNCRTFLDLCAAPGGKTLMAAEFLPPDSRITAADISALRQEQTRENFARHRINGEVITADPSEITGKFDLVIADVPCSNTGVFRRRPDALWRFSGSALAEVMRLQRRIVRRAAELTQDNGFLLVSSCSIEEDENRALTRISGWEVVKECTLLPDDGHDGAFAALMKKVAP
ncbi:MAG: RsmB/NOP family class I SAM-dependent RNA methyltransferase [Lentisphaeria bacterium]|nr:RsmB/NOP family class I SAM-dependent RNA methyltransferase [Lentisphaeria bacterium]